MQCPKCRCVETWVPISEYEGSYEISTLGRIRSLNRYVIRRKNPVSMRKVKGQMIAMRLNDDGYLLFNIWKDKIMRTFSVSPLVWDIFGDGQRDGHNIQVDHIDNDKTHNCITNLQLLSPRENILKKTLPNQKSKYPGVTPHLKRWRSRITVNGIRRHLGVYTTEIQAYLAYEKVRLTLGGR